MGKDSGDTIAKVFKNDSLTEGGVPLWRSHFIA